MTTRTLRRIAAAALAIAPIMSFAASPIPSLSLPKLTAPSLPPIQAPQVPEQFTGFLANVTSLRGLPPLPGMNADGFPIISNLQDIILSAGTVVPKGPGRLPDPTALFTSTIDQVIVSAGTVVPKGPGRLPDPTALIVSLTRLGRPS